MLYKFVQINVVQKIFCKFFTNKLYTNKRCTNNFVQANIQNVVQTNVVHMLYKQMLYKPRKHESFADCDSIGAVLTSVRLCARNLFTELPLPRAYRMVLPNCGYRDRNCYQFPDYLSHLHTGTEELLFERSHPVVY